MVINCVAYGCNNLQDKRNSISFHTFPFKRPEILELWIEAVRRESWKPTKASRLCGEHFLPSDYQIKAECTAKILKPNAVPSKFAFPKHLSKKAILPHRKILKNAAFTIIQKNEIESRDVNLSLTSTIAEQFVNAEIQTNTKSILLHRNVKDVGTQTDISNIHTVLQIRVEDAHTQINTSNILSLLRIKVRTLKKKLKNRNIKISHFKYMINEIRKRDQSKRKLKAVLRN